MGETKRVKLAWNEGVDVAGARVVFAGSAPVNFGPSMPPEGSVLFDVVRGDDTERLTLVGPQDFEATHEALGISLKVVSPYSQEKLREVELDLGAADE